MQNSLQNPMKLIQDLNRFKQGINGDPQQIVMGMVNSGQITQAQLDQAQMMAGQIMNILPK